MHVLPYIAAGKSIFKYKVNNLLITSNYYVIKDKKIMTKYFLSTTIKSTSKIIDQLRYLS